jgi:hypothetical protein
VNDPRARVGSHSRAGTGVVHVSVPFLTLTGTADQGAAQTAAPTARASRGSRRNSLRLLRLVELIQATPVALALLAEYSASPRPGVEDGG